MNRKPVGRPVNPEALAYVGQRHLIWLSPSDTEKLKRLSKDNLVSMSEIIRRLIREA